MKTFEPGQMYEIQCGPYVEIVRVISRTAKFVTFEDELGRIVRRGIKIVKTSNSNVEFAYPGHVRCFATKVVNETTADRHWSHGVKHLAHRFEKPVYRAEWLNEFIAY